MSIVALRVSLTLNTINSNSRTDAHTFVFRNRLLRRTLRYCQILIASINEKTKDDKQK